MSRNNVVFTNKFIDPYFLFMLDFSSQLKVLKAVDATPKMKSIQKRIKAQIVDLLDISNQSSFQVDNWVYTIGAITTGVFPKTCTRGQRL